MSKVITTIPMQELLLISDRENGPVILISEQEAGQTDKDTRCLTEIQPSEMSLMDIMMIPIKTTVEVSILIMRSIKNTVWDSLIT